MLIASTTALVGACLLGAMVGALAVARRARRARELERQRYQHALEAVKNAADAQAKHLQWQLQRATYALVAQRWLRNAAEDPALSPQKSVVSAAGWALALVGPDTLRALLAPYTAADTATLPDGTEQPHSAQQAAGQWRQVLAELDWLCGPSLPDPVREEQLFGVIAGGRDYWDGPGLRAAAEQVLRAGHHGAREIAEQRLRGSAPLQSSH